MDCFDGKPCVTPCRKMNAGTIKVNDLPENCWLRAPRMSSADKSILSAWKGKKLSARSLRMLADLAAGGLAAAEKRETLAGLDTGGKHSQSAYHSLEMYRQKVQEWKDMDRKGTPPAVPAIKVYLLFAAAQNAAGCSDPVLDWFAQQEWIVAVPATVRRCLSLEVTAPPMEDYSEDDTPIKNIEGLVENSNLW